MEWVRCLEVQILHRKHNVNLLLLYLSTSPHYLWQYLQTIYWISTHCVPGARSCSRFVSLRQPLTNSCVTISIINDLEFTLTIFSTTDNTEPVWWASRRCWRPSSGRCRQLASRVCRTCQPAAKQSSVLAWHGPIRDKYFVIQGRNNGVVTYLYSRTCIWFGPIIL